MKSILSALNAILRLIKTAQNPYTHEMRSD
jgi:hypothetical protein